MFHPQVQPPVVAWLEYLNDPLLDRPHSIHHLLSLQPEKYITFCIRKYLAWGSATQQEKKSQRVFCTDKVLIKRLIKKSVIEHFLKCWTKNQYLTPFHLIHLRKYSHIFQRCLSSFFFCVYQNRKCWCKFSLFCD